MPEATLVCIDNSEWMRNGDYAPGRMTVQLDAANVLTMAKLESHAENSVALMTYAGRSPQVHVTLTSDRTRIMTALSKLQLSGQTDVLSGLQVALLALKHRQNKNQRQRVVVFVGSPIETETAPLVQLGKKLKKNNISVDIISFGEEAMNKEKLEAFIAAVNSGDSSHLLSVPAGPHLLSDVLLSSPILADEPGHHMASLASRAQGGDGDIDPNLDPELALALRLSLEEERSRVAAAAAASGDAPPAASSSTNAFAGFESMDEDERMLAQALAMSMGDVGGASGTSDAPAANDGAMDVDMDDEEQELQRALAMSMGGGDQNIGDLLSSLPGVDADSPEVQEALKKLNEGKKKDGKPE